MIGDRPVLVTVPAGRAIGRVGLMVPLNRVKATPAVYPRSHNALQVSQTVQGENFFVCFFFPFFSSQFCLNEIADLAAPPILNFLRAIFQ